MGRPHFHPAACKQCGSSKADGPISQQGLCSECGLERRLVNIAQLEAGSGPYFDHWARRCYLAMRRRVIALEAQLDNVGQEG